MEICEDVCQLFTTTAAELDADQRDMMHGTQNFFPGFPNDSAGNESCLIMQETQETEVRSLCEEDHLEKEMATLPQYCQYCQYFSSILAWRSSQTEEPGRQQSTRSQRVGYD